MKLIFLGSPAEVLSPLKTLLKLHEQGIHELVAIVSQPAKPFGRKRKLQDPPVATFAKEQNILCLQPEKASDPAFLNQLRKLKPDILITAAYGQILKDELLAIPSRATINIHPSALPRYRGATPVQSALLDGCEMTAVCILFTVRKLDAGPIILQRSVPINETERADELLVRLFQIGADMLPEALGKLQSTKYLGETQDETQVTHCSKIQKEDGRINWHCPAKEIFNRFRAFHPWPGSFAFLGDKRIVLVDLGLRLVDTNDSLKLGPGEFQFSKAEKALLAGCGGSTHYLVVRRLKPEGSKELDAASFWNGLRTVGDKGVFS